VAPVREPDQTGELVLVALHPGKTAEMARENTGWDLRTAPTLLTTDPVTERELKILRDELDPTGVHTRGA
jgi:glutaconate CoA-transferase subunit B